MNMRGIKHFPVKHFGQTLLLACLLHAAAAWSQQVDVSEDMRNDAAELSPWSANSARVKRNPDDRCNGFEPFKFLACGPSVTISLELMPGMYGSMEYTTTQGGALAQWMNSLSAMGQATSGNTLEDMARQADSRDGSSINLVIPLIDYGFSGTFNNAAISMNRAHSDTHNSLYQAIGPNDAIPGAGFEFPLSGTVSIEEYSPVVLRGTFSAGMVDLSQSDLSGQDPVLPVLIKLSGSFNIIAPWRGDDRAVVRLSEDVETAARQDINQAFRPSGITGSTNGRTSDAGPPGTRQAGNNGTGGQACDCSCNYISSATSVCAQSCAGSFEACKGEPVPGISASQLAESVSLEEALEQAEVKLREDFFQLMQTTYGDYPEPQEPIDTMMQIFDDMQSYQDRAILHATHGGEKQCPPPAALRDAMMMYELIHCQ